MRIVDVSRAEDGSIVFSAGNARQTLLAGFSGDDLCAARDALLSITPRDQYPEEHDEIIRSADRLSRYAKS